MISAWNVRNVFEPPRKGPTFRAFFASTATGRTETCAVSPWAKAVKSKWFCGCTESGDCETIVGSSGFAAVFRTGRFGNVTVVVPPASTEKATQSSASAAKGAPAFGAWAAVLICCGCCVDGPVSRVYESVRAVLAG